MKLPLAGSPAPQAISNRPATYHPSRRWRVAGAASLSLWSSLSLSQVLAPEWKPQYTDRFGSYARAGSLQSGGEGHASAATSFTGTNVSSAANATRGGSLHALAWTSPEPTGLQPWCTPAPWLCKWSAYGQASWWELVELKGEPGAVIPWSLRLSGSEDNGELGGSSQAYLAFTFSNSPTAWNSPTAIPVGPDSQFSGSFTLGPRGGATLYLYVGVGVYASNGARADYGNSARFYWDLPEGTSYESASGTFSAPAIPVPEPATHAMLAGGLATLFLLRRRWARPH